MKLLSKFLLVAFTWVIALPAAAQNAEMADRLRSEGKIYILLGIVLIVLFGFITYLFLTDRKLTRLEQDLKKDPQTKSGTKSFS